MGDIRGITQSRHYNNGNNDNVMCASVWFGFFVGLFLMSKNLLYMRGKCDTKEGDLNPSHPFPRVWGDFTEVMVYLS